VQATIKEAARGLMAKIVKSQIGEQEGFARLAILAVAES